MNEPRQGYGEMTVNERLRAADIYLTLYFNKARIAWGTLPYPRLRKKGGSGSNRSLKNALVFGGA